MDVGSNSTSGRTTTSSFGVSHKRTGIVCGCCLSIALPRPIRTKDFVSPHTSVYSGLVEWESAREREVCVYKSTKRKKETLEKKIFYRVSIIKLNKDQRLYEDREISRNH